MTRIAPLRRLRSRFKDAPGPLRCEWDITLRDGSKAQCGRYKKEGKLCRQHAKMDRRRTPR